jgi:hypothetical protein
MWNYLWGTTPLWISIPITILLACGVWWLWEERDRRYEYHPQGKGRRIR